MARKRSSEVATPIVDSRGCGKHHSSVGLRPDTALNAGIGANCFANSVARAVPLTEFRLESGNRYQKQHFDCRSYRRRCTRILMGTNIETKYLQISSKQCG